MSAFFNPYLLHKRTISLHTVFICLNDLQLLHGNCQSWNSAIYLQICVTKTEMQTVMSLWFFSFNQDLRVNVVWSCLMLTHAKRTHCRTEGGTRTCRSVGRRKYTQTEMGFITDGYYEKSGIDVSCIIPRRATGTCCEFLRYIQVML